mgnify:CR=1 FL=1
MNDELVARRVAGVTAILSGVAQGSWAILNGVTPGGLDAGAPQVVQLGQYLGIGWNLLLIPVAVFLGIWLRPKSPYLVVVYTVCGLASFLLWAIDSAVMEASWILLSAVWWLGIGFVLRSEHKILGSLTIIVGIAAVLDGMVTLLDLQGPVFALSALKLPLATIWNVWLGIALLTVVKGKSHDLQIPSDTQTEASQ